MIHEVCERRLKAKAKAFRKGEILREAGCNRRRARSNKDANATVADRAGWNRVKRVNVEHAGTCCDVAVADTIGSLECAAIRKAEIARIVAGTRGRSQVRT